MTSPKELQDRGRILYNNGFGFQAPEMGTVDTFVIANLASDYEESLWERVRQLSGSVTVEMIGWIGRDFAQLHWTEYVLIDSVLTAMLQVGMTFAPMSKMDPGFTPKDGIYSEVAREKKWLSQFSENKDLLRTLRHVLGHSFTHEWNWITEEGKQFCRQYRKHLGKPEYCSRPEKHNYFQWAIFRNCDWRTLQSFPSSVPIVAENSPPDEEHSETCMICYDAVADTQVLPCHHKVVCSACSPRLRSTADARVCTQCRCPITHIISGGVQTVV